MGGALAAIGAGGVTGFGCDCADGVDATGDGFTGARQSQKPAASKSSATPAATASHSGRPVLDVPWPPAGTW
jgi:hypothetical protein